MAFSENRPSTPTVNEARYRLAIDAARLGTWTWDVATDVATFDDRVRELLGLSDENARSRASIIETRVHPDDRERLNAALMLAADPSGDGRFQGEYRIVRPDDTERWILAFARMHFSADKEARQAAQLIGTVLDITDQKRAEARQRLLATLGADLLIASDEVTALQELADAAVSDLADWAIVDVIDADGTARRAAMAHADPAKLDVMRELADRYPPDPARPTLGREALHTGRARLYAQIDDALLNVIARDSEQARLARAMGMRSAIAVPLQTRTGPFGIAAFGSGRRSFTVDDLSVAEEIGRRASLAVENARLMTEAKRAQDAEGLARASAEEAGRRLKFLADASAALASLDYEVTLRRVAQLAVPSFADYVIIDLLNEVGELRRVAYAHIDPLKTPLLEQSARYYPSASHNGHPFREPLEKGEPILVAHVDDSWTRRLAPTPEHLAVVQALEPSSAIMAPLSARGHTLGLMTFATSASGRAFTAADVSLAGEVAQRAAVAVDNARLYRQSEIARHEAEAASRAKGQFLAVMSHELRTPLNAILGYSELVEMGVHGPVSDAQREAMGRIRRSGQHLLALVNNVLNLERSETNNLETEFATLTVAQLFDDASMLTRPQAEAKAITLTVHSPSLELSVLGEREKAGQVLVNLLSNAVKFTPSGGRIDLAYEIGDDAVTLRVSDSGPGIPADSLNRIFEPFVQLDSGLTRRAEGAGLGLAISRRLARLMGGDLTVASEVGKGSTFAFTLVRVN